MHPLSSLVLAEPDTKSLTKEAQSQKSPVPVDRQQGNEGVFKAEAINELAQAWKEKGFILWSNALEAPVESRTVLTLPSVFWLSDHKEMTRIVQGKCSQLHDEAVASIPIL